MIHSPTSAHPPAVSSLFTPRANAAGIRDPMSKTLSRRRLCGRIPSLDRRRQLSEIEQVSENDQQRPLRWPEERQDRLHSRSTVTRGASRSACEGPPEEPGMGATFGRAGLGAFRLGWTVFVVAATSIPYLLNVHSTPPGSHYTWIMPPYPEDSMAYRAWSEQAAHGSLLFQMKYTALPHAPFLFHPFFLIGGCLSALTACDIGIMHWGLKAAGVVLFFMAFFKYTDYMRVSGIQSILATVLVGVSSGFGGLLVLFGLAKRLPALPADLWVVDSNTFWSLLWNPLFPWSLTLMLIAIHRLDRGTREGRTMDLWQSGLATGAMVLIHPYSQRLLFTLALAPTILR